MGADQAAHRSTTGHVSVEFDDRIATVCLDRPRVNALDSATYAELASTFEQLAESEADIAVLRTQGRHFCAGNDLNEAASIAEQDIPIWLDNARRAFAAIHDCPIPIIAAVQGAALGSGLQLAASCDLVVASRDARFGLPEITVGMMGGASHLARLVPWPVVRLMFYTGQPLEADELAAYGGLARVVPAGSAADAAGELARSIATSGTKALRLAKRSLNTIETMALAEGYSFEASLTAELLVSPGSRERAGRPVTAARETSA